MIRLNSGMYRFVHCMFTCLRLNENRFIHFVISSRNILCTSIIIFEYDSICLYTRFYKKIIVLVRISCRVMYNGTISLPHVVVVVKVIL